MRATTQASRRWARHGVGTPTLPIRRHLGNIWLISAVTRCLATTMHAAASETAASSAAQTQTDVKYRILAFGDSLTEGFCNYGFDFHPYSKKLEDLLTEHGFSAKAYERGRSGERVLGGMDARLPALLQQAEAQGVLFDWVVILGGINDIGYGKRASRIYAGLKQLYAACHEHGARVLALTCMETVTSRLPDGPDERTQLNDLIRDTPGELGYVEVLDLEQALPFPSGPSDTATAALWDDGLHLTPQGYDRMGEIVFGALQSRLEK